MTGSVMQPRAHPSQGIRILQASSYPLQVLLKDHSRAFQAGLSQPVPTQPEALCVDRHHRRVEVHLANKPQFKDAS